MVLSRVLYQEIFVRSLCLTSEDELVHEVEVNVVRHQLLEPASKWRGAALAAEVDDPVPSRDELPFHSMHQEGKHRAWGGGAGAV